MSDAALWPVSPFLRRRWRRRLGLPDDLVISVAVPGAPALDDRAAADALFLCAAAVVGSSHIAEALALGTPTVCSSETAASAGAVHGEHVVVSDDPAHARREAEALAADDARAATLARNASRLVAREPVTVGSGVARLTSELMLLGTPPGADVCRRIAGHVASLGPTAATAVGDAFGTDGPGTYRLPDAESARRLAEALGLPLPEPAPAPLRPPPPRRSIRERLAGKSARQIAAAIWRRARRELRR